MGGGVGMWGVGCGIRKGEAGGGLMDKVGMVLFEYAWRGIGEVWRGGIEWVLLWCFGIMGNSVIRL